ncbi:LysR family transcriptional regulator [Rathayibacter sp. VKM Ac-2856]|uniref:LysR family transcriptional regulator n=1 Tax=unclassified Rathayibacter TaxID=2609250 RepID=UPI001563C7A5|nr:MULTISPECIES: LysR family transcriptional regulator [unclassified Rathayibacter]NQX05826.1 LysR family transcriptional regulator [Rathayibacter sp. VKM Ac-2858]NQX21224.1 LysR family transcriptional regulator [Rathayibacter sp. VKM Ac-2856]
MVSVRQWEYLLRVVDLGSFTGAADELGVTQPGLSQQIRALERELGGRLLDRLPRGVALTPLGRAVLPPARAVVADAQRALAAAAAVLAAETGTIDVVTITSLGLGVLPGVLEVWLQEHPGASVTVIEHQSVDAVVAAMSAGAGDVALAPMPRSWSGPSRLIGREEFVVVAGSDHPLAGRSSVDLAALADEPWVHFALEHGLAGVLDRYAAEAGFVPRVALRTPQTAAVPRFAAAGVGLGLVPRNILDSGFRGAVLPLDPARTRAVRAFTRADPDPLVAAFIETVAAHADLSGPTGRSRRGRR